VVFHDDLRVLTRLYFENESQRVKGKRSIPSANIKPHTEAFSISLPRNRGRAGVGGPESPRSWPIRTLFRRLLAANPYTVCLQRDRPPQPKSLPEFSKYTRVSTFKRSRIKIPKVLIKRQSWEFDGLNFSFGKVFQFEALPLSRATRNQVERNILGKTTDGIDQVCAQCFELCLPNLINNADFVVPTVANESKFASCKGSSFHLHWDDFARFEMRSSKLNFEAGLCAGPNSGLRQKKQGEVDLVGAKAIVDRFPHLLETRLGKSSLPGSAPGARVRKRNLANSRRRVEQRSLVWARRKPRFDWERGHTHQQ
jgi:hypothetical protein